LYVGEKCLGEITEKVLAHNKLTRSIQVIHYTDYKVYTIDPRIVTKITIGETHIQVHPLKTEVKFFDKVADGIKPFEVRKDDRDFQVGDILFLEEYSKNTDSYTGANTCKIVTYILGREPDEIMFVPVGYVVIGIQ
jgi:hypothetical protein